MARTLDGQRDVLGDCGSELHEFAVRTFQSEAMLVFAARGVRPERGDAAAVRGFNRLRPPLFRRAVNFRRKPFFDVPAIHGRIFRFLPQLDDFAKQRARCGIAVLKFPADPGQAIPAPDGAIVRFADWVAATGQFETISDRVGRIVRFAENRDRIP